ncbi:MAG: AsmA family protein, partial [Bauldia sp.]
MSRLFVILGGLVVIALFAALIAPWFINWNDYRGGFEAEAGRILGQPVKVAGSASASILPSPSLTFTNVRVGDIEGRPMMTVDRFEVTIELMPLLQGEIRVTSMKLRRPVATVSVDDSGTVDWFLRNEASKTLDPDRVVLENVEISEGQVTYNDARTGIARVFERINGQVEAGSLYGPWRVDGSYLDNGQRVPFRVSTGRRAENGTIRVKTELSPANWPVTLSAEGEVANDADGVYYAGTYNLAEVVLSDGTGEAQNFGWRSEGAFTLTRDRLVIDKAVLSQGPPERPYSVAGSLTVDLGANPYFDAAIVARQLDLDRSLGKGPTAPVEPAKASESLVKWLSNFYIPPIRGRLAFSVPGIIVGGAVIQDASFKAEPRVNGWKITDLKASLPGKATLEASGALATVGGVGFNGD